MRRWEWSAPWDGVGATGGRRTHSCPSGPRSVPARRKQQAAPPLQPPPPPPPSDDLPWGDLTLNKCLVLASLVALLGSALQLCRGELHRDWGIPSSLALGCDSIVPTNLRLKCFFPYSQNSLSPSL